MGVTAQDQQSRAAYEDGKWYWVEHEGWHGEPPTIAPACYKAECDAWYSYIFSGISTPYLKVLGPCELQAARALPAGMEPVAVASMPFCKLEWLIGETVSAAEVAEISRQGAKLYTAAQVQAMGRVPPEWQAVPMESTRTMKAAGRQALKGAADCTSTGQAVIVFEAMCSAAPRPPAAPATTEPQTPTTGAGRATAAAAQEFKPFTDEELGNIVMGIDSELAGNAKALIRAVERAHGIT